MSQTLGKAGSREEEISVYASPNDPGYEFILDGNATAGLLREIIRSEMTLNHPQCASCGEVSMLGARLVNGGVVGSVLRCHEAEGLSS